MSLPVEVDWILLKLEDTPDSGTFTLVCGIEDVNINGGVNTSDRFVRDCAAPGAPPARKTKVTGLELDISGSGLSNTQEITRLNAALGALRNWKAELYREGPTDAGVLLGTYAGEFRMTTNNLAGPRNADSSMEIALASHGDWTYTDAAGKLMPTEVDLKFGDGDYLFALRLPQILELQRSCNAGIFAIYGRVLRGRYRTADGVEFGVPGECEAFINDLYDVVRLALIGGGKGRVNGADVEVSPLRAKELVETYSHGQPLVETWKFAAAALHALIEGYDDQKKKPGAGRKAADGLDEAEVLTNCAMMGVDDRRLTYRQYQGMLGEWNSRQPGADGGKSELGPSSDRLKAAMAAHMTTQ